ncbi:hypothetical protein [Beduinella massiliensis]|uniref:hypothetical protein n=1 Tax=Beduinella massiliensis TaxID=1852363 RepID=UPI000C854592
MNNSRVQKTIKTMCLLLAMMPLLITATASADALEDAWRNIDFGIKEKTPEEKATQDVTVAFILATGDGTQLNLESFLDALDVETTEYLLNKLNKQYNHLKNEAVVSRAEGYEVRFGTVYTVGTDILPGEYFLIPREHGSFFDLAEEMTSITNPTPLLLTEGQSINVRLDGYGFTLLPIADSGSAVMGIPKSGTVVCGIHFEPGYYVVTTDATPDSYSPKYTIFANSNDYYNHKIKERSFVDENDVFAVYIEIGNYIESNECIFMLVK